MSPTPLEIKAAALQRLMKEHKLYLQEHADQQQHISSLEQANADPYDIKKQREVLADTERVLPEIKKKIEQMAVSLEELLKEYDGEEDVTVAKHRLTEAHQFLLV